MKPRLYLVDAHAYIHRAYHALPPLTNSKGEPVGALFGFARMLLQLLKREKPDRIVVCFDMPGPTFRHKVFAPYKATRKEIDKDLLTQLALAQEMAQAMGFHCIGLPGYEADDVMATLARGAVGEEFDAVLVTGDKDALQMVGPGIRVLNVAKGVWMDPAQIEEKLGVPPGAVVDYLAITGDVSDNVPGLRGVGPVGAAKLLKKYGSVAAAIKAAKAGDPEMPAKMAKALVDGEEDVLRAVSLIRLDDKAPLDIKVSQLKPLQADPERLKESFGRFGFTSLLKEMLPNDSSLNVPAETLGAPAPSPAREVAFKEIEKELASASAILVTCLPNKSQDLIDNSRVSLALGLPDGRVAVCAEADFAKNKAVLKAFEGSALKIGYDLKETAATLQLLGLRLKAPLFDTKLAAYVINPQAPKPIEAAKTPRDFLLGRAALALGHEALLRRMEETGVLRLYEDVELPVLEALRAMEAAGIALDAPYLKNLAVEFDLNIEKLRETLNQMAGAPINVNSPKQLGELLYDRLGLPVAHKTAKGGRSTNEEALQTLATLNPIPAKVLEYRELTKLKSTYIDGLLARLDADTGRVHTHYDQAGTATGRLSSLDPNLQNIPIRSILGQKIRRAFIAQSGCVLLSSDYSQIDLRVLAHVSGDKVLKEAFSRDEDVHLRTACEVFQVPANAVDKEMRRCAKAINFGIVYGQTAHGLSQQIGVPYGQAAEYIKNYFIRYEGVYAWLKKNLEKARRDGFVRTFTGRIRYLPDLAAKNAAARQFAERAAGNTPIQGGSADVIKIAMARIHEELSKSAKFKARMLLQIHDELLFEVPKGELRAFGAWVREIMEGAVKMDVPLTVDLKSGPNWQDMEK